MTRSIAKHVESLLNLFLFLLGRHLHYFAGKTQSGRKINENSTVFGMEKYAVMAILA